jgi:hypothetical protein
MDNFLRHQFTPKQKEEVAFIQRAQTQAPVNIVGIAKLFGLGVWEDHKLPPGIAAKIFHDPKHGGRLGYSIVIRGQDPYQRKTFSVAHELAHYILHRDKFIDGALIDDSDYRSSLSIIKEADANALAADFLMPWHLILEYADLDIPELAKKFDVPEEVMRLRLKYRPEAAKTPALAI